MKQIFYSVLFVMMAVVIISLAEGMERRIGADAARVKRYDALCASIAARAATNRRLAAQGVGGNEAQDDRDFELSLLTALNYYCP